jgi:hypothetical protein
MTRKPKPKPKDESLSSSSDITIQVSTEGLTDSTVIEVKASGGDEHQRADVVEMILLHLDGLWTELADCIKTVEFQDPRYTG